MIHSQTRGFTLIEIVVALVILGVIAGFVGTPLISTITARATINKEVGQDADAVFALEKITNEIRFARSSTIECGENHVKIIYKSGTDEFHYEYVESNDTLMADIESVDFDLEGVVLTDVVNFSCENITNLLNLYELTLELKTEKEYISTAYQRNS